jgi:hypothetical protein
MHVLPVAAAFASNRVFAASAPLVRQRRRPPRCDRAQQALCNARRWWRAGPGSVVRRLSGQRPRLAQRRRPCNHPLQRGTVVVGEGWCRWCGWAGRRAGLVEWRGPRRHPLQRGTAVVGGARCRWCGVVGPTGWFGAMARTAVPPLATWHGGGGGWPGRTKRGAVSDLPLRAPRMPRAFACHRALDPGGGPSVWRMFARAGVRRRRPECAERHRPMEREM